MVDDTLRRQLAAEPDAAACILLQWTDAPGPALFEGLTSKRQRLEAATLFYSRLKSPCLARIQAPGIVVEDLPASPQAILRGPSKALLQLLEEGSPLATDPGLHALPSTLFHALPHPD